MDTPEVPKVQIADIVALIRKKSEATELASKTFILSVYPEEEIETLFPSKDFTDILFFSGSTEPYYYSTLSMTENYARHLFRIAENDPLRLVADTVRDDSRIYPRPTASKIFKEAPFRLDESTIDELISRLGSETGTADIRVCSASNGAVYFYSNEFLTDAHAESLAEWDEVERWNNP